MSSLPTDNPNKRPALDSSEDASSRMPNKRAHSASQPTSQDVEQSDDQDETMDAFKEPLDVYRRDAISRQWKEYMRSGNRLLRRVETVKDRKLESSQQLQSWQAHLNQLKFDLQRLLTDYSLERSNQNSDSDIGATLTDDWINENTVNMNDTIKQAKKSMIVSALGVADVLKSWSIKRTHFAETFDLDRLTNKDLVQDYKMALSSWLKGQHSTNEANHQYRITKLKFLLLCEELRLLKFRLGLSDHILHETRLELLNTENRLAKKTSTTRQETEQQPSTLEQEVGPLSANEQGQMRTIMEHQQDPIVRAQKTLDQQLREIEVIKEQRIDLKQQILQLELDLVHIPESRIYKSAICRQLYQSREYQRDKTQHLTSHVDKLVQDVEDMRRHRRRLMEEMDMEQMVHIRALEERMANLEYELTRVRGQRDELQCKIEMGKADSQEGYASSVKEWQIVADTRKQRASTMETELSRWLQKCAARTGSSEFYQYVTGLGHHILSLDSLVNEQRELETKVSNLKQHMLSAPGLTDAAERFLDEELNYTCQLKLLEDEVNVFKTTYGFDPIDATPDQVIESLQDTIAKEQAAIHQSRERVEVLQSTENQFLDEIGNIAKVYGEFDEQNTDKIKKLAQDEDDFIQLQCERVKYSQTFTALNKSKDAHAMVANALTKQIEKQMSYIKQLNEREKNLGSQIASLERQLGAGKSASDIYQQKVSELKTSVDEVKEKVVFSKEKIVEVEQSIMDTIRNIEEGAHSRLRIEENSELLWRKIEATTKVEKPAEMKLRKEKEEFRVSGCVNQLI
ncbi:hypothetical protein BCR42DRAFT_425011 [Absidia repens]|uniref:E3 ubiquitin protein ligase n=1 Tax=Absidia repens TaxID=90262 RepID=A0A1X2I3F1_9FUNG|nr:hypothetical protein BCR42DRAFT_425011 [Absidia repens]